jgi:hypothetical protein
MCSFCTRVPAVKGDHCCRNCRDAYFTPPKRAKSKRRKSLLGDAILVIHWKGVVLKQVYHGGTVEVAIAPERLPATYKGHGGSFRDVLNLNKFVPRLDRDTVKRYKAVFKPYLVRAGVA